jgi:hypothetical protein
MLILGLVLSLLVDEASATTFVPETLDVMLGRSALVFEGDVVDVWYDVLPESGLPVTRALIDTTDVLLGSVPYGTVDFFLPGGVNPMTGHAVDVEGAPAIHVGDHVLVSAFLARENDHWLAAADWDRGFLRRVEVAPGDYRALTVGGDLLGGFNATSTLPIRGLGVCDEDSGIDEAEGWTIQTGPSDPDLVLVVEDPTALAWSWGSVVSYFARNVDSIRASGNLGIEY